MVEIVDTAERVDGLLPLLDEMVADGLVTIEPVRVVSYRAASSGAPGTTDAG